jgi:hypothetical protein
MTAASRKALGWCDMAILSVDRGQVAGAATI